MNTIDEELPVLVLGKKLTPPDGIVISLELEGVFVLVSVDAVKSLGWELIGGGDPVGVTVSLEEIAGACVGTTLPTLGKLLISVEEELEMKGTHIVGSLSGTRLLVG